MLVPAPGRFSTTNCWPRYSLSLDAARRALMSTPPPGVNPTSTRAGRLGYWARAACVEHASTRKAIAVLTLSSGAEARAPDVERGVDEAGQPAAAVLHRQDVFARQHCAEEPLGVP